MIHRPESLAAAVRDFRELTAREAEASATRARVLTQASGRSRPRWARLGGLPVLLIIVIASAAAAATGVVAHRAPVPIVLETSASALAPLPHDHPRRQYRTIPPMRTATSAAPAADESGVEASLYGVAHAAHFGGAAPARALAAWDDYLRAHPHGRFEPEARFNRALCSIRLQRFVAAADDLVPFANGRYGEYRRAEAARLLEWMKPALSAAAAR